MKDTIEILLVLQPFAMTIAIALVHGFSAYARAEVERARQTADDGDDARAAKLFDRAMKVERAAKTLGDLLTLGLTYRQRQSRAASAEGDRQ